MIDAAPTQLKMILELVADQHRSLVEQVRKRARTRYGCGCKDMCLVSHDHLPPIINVLSTTLHFLSSADEYVAFEKYWRYFQLTIVAFVRVTVLP